MCRRNKALVKELSTPPPGAKDLYFATEFSQPTWGQFKSCLWKTWWTYWRSPDYNLVRFFFTLAAALMVGTIFWRVGTNRYSSVSFLCEIPKKSHCMCSFILINFIFIFPPCFLQLAISFLALELPYQILKPLLLKYYIIILMLTSAFSVSAMHSVCHINYFRS